MPLPEYAKRAITRSIEKSQRAGAGASEMAQAIIDDLAFAEELMGDAAPRAPERPPARNVLIQTSGPALPVVDLDRGIVLDIPKADANAEMAPPPAFVRNPDGQSANLSEDEIESRKSTLRAKIAEMMPQTMVLDLPDVGKILLARFIKAGPAMLGFVNVQYAQGPEEIDGPLLVINIDQIDKLDGPAMQADIASQALLRYRKTRLRIEPRAAPPAGMPNLEEISRNPGGGPVDNRTDDRASEKEMNDWNDRRSPIIGR